MEQTNARKAYESVFGNETVNFTFGFVESIFFADQCGKKQKEGSQWCDDELEAFPEVSQETFESIFGLMKRLREKGIIADPITSIDESGKIWECYWPMPKDHSHPLGITAAISISRNKYSSRHNGEELNATSLDKAADFLSNAIIKNRANFTQPVLTKLF